MRLGRQPRSYDPRVPKMINVRKGITFPPPPAVNYAAGMPANLGTMLNNVLGDCTAAAVGHALQVWSYNAAPSMITPSDTDILALYEVTGGYVVGNPSTDNGAVEQEVLKYWLNDSVDSNKLSAFVEVDVLNTEEVKRTIAECGVIYIGFNVPAYLMNNLTAPGSKWDIDRTTADNAIVGGHAVVVAGYDATGTLSLISWGSHYTMTRAFWTEYVDEAYALANKEWIKATGKTPAGLDLAELEALMQSMKPPIGPPSQRRKHRHHRRVNRR